MSSKTSLKPNLFSEHSRFTKGVFSELSASEREDLLHASKRRAFSRGSFVVRAQERADYFFIVLEGTLEVSRTAAHGKSVILNRIGEGEVIGEVSALAGISRTADVCCITNCVLAEISVNVFREKLSKLPHFAAFIMRSLALRLSSSTRKLFDIATEDVPSRVLQALLTLEPQSAGTGEEYYLIRERPTHAELARLVGTSREVVGRALTLLEKAGEIQQDGKSIFVKLA